MLLYLHYVNHIYISHPSALVQLLSMSTGSFHCTMKRFSLYYEEVWQKKKKNQNMDNSKTLC